MSKLVVLSDNRTADIRFKTEHGLCMLLDNGVHKILLDTGASPLFLENAMLLGLNILDIDYVFISHGHSDHIGGLQDFLRINKKAKVILSKNIVGRQFYSTRKGVKSIGQNLPFEEWKERLLFIEEATDVTSEIKVFPCNEFKEPSPKANQFLFTNHGFGLELDDFDHELIFTCKTNTLFVYTGCAHAGLINMLKVTSKNIENEIDLVVGGFHLLDHSDGHCFETEADIEILAKWLKKNCLNASFKTGHCTGEAAFGILKSHLNVSIEQFFVGYTLKF